jgi:hypothetical protein
MTLRSLSRNRLHENSRPLASGQPFRRCHRGDDPTQRIARLTEALHQYGVNIPQTLLAGPENICWIG